MLGRKIFSLLFGLVGLCLMVGTVVLCLGSLHKNPALVEVSAAAQQRAEAFLEAVAQGDYAEAGTMMLGQPDLGADREPADAVGVLVWDAFVVSMKYEFTGDFYATENGIARDVRMTCLDVSGVTQTLEERAKARLQQRVSENGYDPELYDENGNYREDFVEEVLLEAAEQALQEDGKTTSRELTLKLVFQGDQWWVVPEQALLEAISGGLAG